MRILLVIFAILYNFNALCSPTMYVPIEIMEKYSTNIFLIIPSKFTFTHEDGHIIAHYEYSKIKSLKGNISGSPLLIYDYPENDAKMMAKCFDGLSTEMKESDSISTSDVIDILFLYHDEVTGRLFSMNYDHANLLVLAKYFDDIKTINDIPLIIKKAMDEHAVMFLYNTTKGSSNLEWRANVESCIQVFNETGQKQIKDALNNPPLDLKLSLENFLSFKYQQKKDLLRANVNLLILNYLLALSQGNLQDLSQIMAGGEQFKHADLAKSQEVLSELQQSVNLGVIKDIQYEDISPTGHVVDVTGLIVGEGGKKRFRALLNHENDVLKVLSLKVTDETK